DFALPCIVAGVLSASAAVLALVLLPKPAPTSQPQVGELAAGDVAPLPSLRAMLGASGVRLFVLQFALHTCAVSASIYLFPLWVSQGLGWTAHEVGLFFGLVGVVMIVTQGNFLGRMTDRFGTIWVLRAAAVTFSLSLLLSTVASGALAMGALGLLAFSAATLCLPVLNTIASHAVPAPWRGQFFGVTASSASFGRVGGPLIAATLLAQGNFGLAWLGTSAIVMLVVGWSILQGPNPIGGLKISESSSTSTAGGH
ncbi:MAG: MFS transporter, partial [Halieaceae bacterium]